MKISTIHIALSFCFLSAYANAADRPVASPVSEKLIELSGVSANDCGIFQLDANLAPGWECALKSDADGRPFWLAVQVHGTDSDVWRAIGRSDSGKRYLLNYDSYPRGESTSERNFTVIPCADKFEWAQGTSRVLGCSGSAH